LMKFVPDRLGHDRRYSLNWDKLKELGWHPEYSLNHGLSATIQWYQEYRWWWEKIKSGDFLDYYKNQYNYSA